MVDEQRPTKYVNTDDMKLCGIKKHFENDEKWNEVTFKNAKGETASLKMSYAPYPHDGLKIKSLPKNRSLLSRFFLQLLDSSRICPKQRRTLHLDNKGNQYVAFPLLGVDDLSYFNDISEVLKFHELFIQSLPTGSPVENQEPKKSSE